MTIKVKDLDQQSAWTGGSMLPVGPHQVEIDRAEEGTSSGNFPQIELEFVALNGGGSIRDWLVFTEGTLGKARALLDAVAIEPQGGDWDFPTAMLPKRKLTITVGEETDYKDPTKMRRKVLGYAPPGSSPTADSGSQDNIPF